MQNVRLVLRLHPCLNAFIMELVLAFFSISVYDIKCLYHFLQYHAENLKENHFNQINFREIKFRDLANFCHFRENKTRENVWNCWFAKSNWREIFNIAFWVEKSVKTLHLCPKIVIATAGSLKRPRMAFIASRIRKLGKHLIILRVSVF